MPALCSADAQRGAECSLQLRLVSGCRQQGAGTRRWATSSQLHEGGSVLLLLHRQTSTCCWRHSAACSSQQIPLHQCVWVMCVCACVSVCVCVCVCVSQSPCLSQSSLNTNRSVCVCAPRSIDEKRRAEASTQTTRLRQKRGKKMRKNPYAFSCFLSSSSSSCRRLVASLGSAGCCRRCHGNGGGLTVGRGGGDVTASVPVTWQLDGGLAGDLCTAAGGGKRRRRYRGRERGMGKGGGVKGRDEGRQGEGEWKNGRKRGKGRMWEREEGNEEGEKARGGRGEEGEEGFIVIQAELSPPLSSSQHPSFTPPHSSLSSSHATLLPAVSSSVPPPALLSSSIIPQNTQNQCPHPPSSLPAIRHIIGHQRLNPQTSGTHTACTHTHTHIHTQTCRSDSSFILLYVWIHSCSTQPACDLRQPAEAHTLCYTNETHTSMYTHHSLSAGTLHAFVREHEKHTAETTSLRKPSEPSE